MTAIAKLKTTTVSAMSEDDLIAVLKCSLYPGAQDNSIRMVLKYCEAAKLDPLQKPVHIVPMLVPTGRKNNSGYDIKEYRDVIMPGIGLYRIQASRTNQYVGITEPEYGEEVTAELDGVTVTYPKWCRITVDKLVGNEVRRFAAKEYWTENYATKSNSSLAPNAMWFRRPFAQLAKCVEAQALRKAFPDNVGAAPTAEEMEGKEYGEVIDHDTGEVTVGKPRVSLPQSKAEVQQASEAQGKGHDAQPTNIAPQEEKEPEKEQGRLATEGEKNFLLGKMESRSMSATDVLAACKVDCLETMTEDDFKAMKEYVLKRPVV